MEAGARAPDKPAEAMDPGTFIAPRLYVSDATIERLATLLQARPRGMAMICDELAGLFLNMGRYSNGSDREFWLEAWNGSSFVVERQTKPPVTVDHLLIGMTGGFQPDKLVASKVMTTAFMVVCFSDGRRSRSSAVFPIAHRRWSRSSRQPLCG